MYPTNKQIQRRLRLQGRLQLLPFWEASKLRPFCHWGKSKSSEEERSKTKREEIIKQTGPVTPTLCASAFIAAFFSFLEGFFPFFGLLSIVCNVLPGYHHKYQHCQHCHYTIKWQIQMGRLFEGKCCCWLGFLGLYSQNFSLRLSSSFFELGNFLLLLFLHGSTFYSIFILDWPWIVSNKHAFITCQTNVNIQIQKTYQVHHQWNFSGTGGLEHFSLIWMARDLFYGDKQRKSRQRYKKNLNRRKTVIWKFSLIVGPQQKS